MGQAFRRASGRLRAPDPPPKVAVDRKLPGPPADKVEKVYRKATQLNNQDIHGADDHPRINADNVLEEKDPQFDAMLGQMVGRIKTKPGGKPEMGEATIVERSQKPLPKLRNTTASAGRYEERPVPPGTLNVAQLRHILKLHAGKGGEGGDSKGPVDVHQISQQFRLEVEQVKKFLQFVSLPPEDSTKKDVQ